MATNKLVDDEKNVCLKIDRFIDEYEFEVLFDIEAGIAELKKINRNLGGNSCGRRRELEEEYEDKYKN